MIYMFLCYNDVPVLFICVYISDGIANTDIIVGSGRHFSLCRKISGGEYVHTSHVYCYTRQVGRLVRFQKNVYSTNVPMCLCEVQVYGYIYYGMLIVYVDVKHALFGPLSWSCHVLIKLQYFAYKKAMQYFGLLSVIRLILRVSITLIHFKSVRITTSWVWFSVKRIK